MALASAPRDVGAVRALRVAGAQRGRRGTRTVKLARLEEVEDGPQLGDVVLQRRAGEHVLAARTQLAQLIKHLGGAALEAVTFVNDHRRPLDAAHRFGVRIDHLVRSEHNLEAVTILLAVRQLARLGEAPVVREDRSARVERAVKGHRVHAGPHRDLALPCQSNAHATFVKGRP